MHYSDDFKRRVMAAFGTEPALAACLESGSAFVGRWLDDSRGLDVTPEEVISAIESGDTRQLLAKADKAKAMGRLYREWCALPDNSWLHPSNHKEAMKAWARENTEQKTGGGPARAAAPGEAPRPGEEGEPGARSLTR